MILKRPLVLAAILIASTPLFSCTSAPTATEDREPAATPVPRDQLWGVVKGCVATANTSAFKPPCIEIDRPQSPQDGYVLLKDPKGPTHFLMIPTAQVTGIEDPKVVAPGAPNYWEAAWEARAHVSKILGQPVPDSALGLAANPPFARSQDQLHIHIDCVRPDVITALKNIRPKLSSNWEQNPLTLVGTPYQVLYLKVDSLQGTNPFQLLKASADVGGVESQMGLHTLVVIGADGKDGGFYVIKGKGSPTDTAHRLHGEDLLDATCSIVKH